MSNVDNEHNRIAPLRVDRNCVKSSVSFNGNWRPVMRPMPHNRSGSSHATHRLRNAARRRRPCKVAQAPQAAAPNAQPEMLERRTSVHISSTTHGNAMPRPGGAIGTRSTVARLAKAAVFNPCRHHTANSAWVVAQRAMLVGFIAGPNNDDCFHLAG